MRKLKLQMFMSIDGFVASLDDEKLKDDAEPEKPSEENDVDPKLEAYLISTIETSSTILLGRKMTDGFITYWEDIADNQQDNPEHELAKLLVATPKVIFSKTLKESTWDNATLATGDLIEEVNKLKAQSGKDIIVYGGGGFVSSLIAANLIDEYHLFINPHVLGRGMPIFNKLTRQFDLKLKSTDTFNPDIVLLVYEPKRS